MNEENRPQDEEFTPEETNKEDQPDNCPADPAEDGNTIPDILAKGQVSVQLPYRKIADFTEIITGWQKEWNEGYPTEQEHAENWHLHSPAILPGNRLALLFEKNDEVYDGRGEVAHVTNWFRVLIYDLDTLDIVQRFAFRGQDMEVRTVLYTPDREGIQAVVKVGHHENDVWSVLPMVPTNDDGQYKIGPYVKDVLQFANGGIAASYTHNDLDEAKIPVAVWSPDGKCVGGLKEPEELECAAMTFDNDYGVWAHFMPSGKIKRFGKEELTFGSVYQGFSEFGVSSDRLLMAVSWQRGVCENRMYLMYRKGERFEAFGKLDFSHLPGREDPLQCGAYGFPVFYGSRFLFNKDGVLYLFDLDRAAEIWMN